MRPQIGKRAQRNSVQEKGKTLSREYIEKNLRKNLTIREEYLPLEDIKTAININAMEQRIFARKRVIKLLQQNLSPGIIIQKLEEENHFDRHRMIKMG
ncbi:MAG: hypothetical protein B6D64_01790 [Bacteroidetes bacterium 4484_276]|nr:MAG: hypothetical protein B6D64_01790 [Bacteroidetes bacterium 4484_276]OYT13877.1 MAG: hypothetical protein B6I19_02765 [Bacteroidetes bacterium 4572_114]